MTVEISGITKGEISTMYFTGLNFQNSTGVESTSILIQIPDGTSDGLSNVTIGYSLKEDA